MTDLDGIVSMHRLMREWRKTGLPWRKQSWLDIDLNWRSIIERIKAWRKSH